MKTLSLSFLAGLLVLALAQPAAVAQESSEVAATGDRVSVELGDFDQMRETKHLRGVQRRDTERSVRTLSEWLQKRIERQLPEGQQMKVVLADVDLAGDYIPGRGPSMDTVRVIKDLYPPRITLSWQRLDADGDVLDEGDEVLVDMAFMSGGANMTDPLRFEKRLLSQWLRERLKD